MRLWCNSDLDNTYISADANKNLILETYNVFLDVIYLHFYGYYKHINGPHCCTG